MSTAPAILINEEETDRERAHELYQIIYSRINWTVDDMLQSEKAQVQEHVRTMLEEQFRFW